MPGSATGIGYGLGSYHTTHRASSRRRRHESTEFHHLGPLTRFITRPSAGEFFQL